MTIEILLLCILIMLCKGYNLKVLQLKKEKKLPKDWPVKRKV